MFSLSGFDGRYPVSDDDHDESRWKVMFPLALAILFGSAFNMILIINLRTSVPKGIGKSMAVKEKDLNILRSSTFQIKKRDGANS